MDEDKKSNKKQIIIAIILSAVISSLLTIGITSCVNAMSTPMHIVLYKLNKYVVIFFDL